MMKLLSHWLEAISKGRLSASCDYESVIWLESEMFPGVEFSIKKMSLSQRIALSAQVRELTMRNEFLKSGDVTETIQATLAELLVQKLYIEWAVVAIKGLRIDGKIASIEDLVQRGPELLVLEMADAIYKQLNLSDAERKNS